MLLLLLAKLQALVKNQSKYTASVHVRDKCRDVMCYEKEED